MSYAHATSAQRASQGHSRPKLSARSIQVVAWDIGMVRLMVHFGLGLGVSFVTDLAARFASDLVCLILLFMHRILYQILCG